MKNTSRRNLKAERLGVDWRKSSKSGPYSDNCVEVAEVGDLVGVRDSTDPSGPILQFSPDRWLLFVREARLGKFDVL